MKFIHKSFTILARLFISIVFIGGALHKVFDWHESEKLLLSSLSDWQGYIGFWESAQSFIGFITPWAPLLLVVATALEFCGGLLLLLGIKEKLGASLLILSLIPITIVMHPFWFVEDPSKEVQTLMFFKNLAILGGLMMILLREDRYAESDSMNFGS
jgi:uncharacterized membrane protein YphA (DoxX/SURF4 family)